MSNAYVNKQPRLLWRMNYKDELGNKLDAYKAINRSGLEEVAIEVFMESQGLTTYVYGKTLKETWQRAVAFKKEDRRLL